MIDHSRLRELASTLPTEHGELSYADRRSLRAELRASSDEELLQLETLCARRAFSVWYAAFPDDSRPADVLEQALQSPSDSRLPASLDELRTHLDNTFDLGEEYFPAIYAGFACWAVARNAVGYRPTEPDEINGELELDPDQWSPCFLASLAEAGGATWEPDTDHTKRRAFWEWYLLEAIPAADTNQ